MLFIVILNVLFVWICPANSAYYETFKSKQFKLLNDGNIISLPAYGTAMYDLNNRKYIPQSVIWAIEAGYRHIDTAALYGSEDKIGEAINNVTRRCVVKRTELFITSKLVRHIIPIAASLDKEHIESNIDIFDFTISPEDVLIINEFDKNIKVHINNYDGLEEEMHYMYRYLKRFAQENNLEQYKNI